MNFQVAAVVAGVFFALSFVAGLLGGVGLFDIFLSALFWGLLGLGGSLGVETLVRTFLPELLAAEDGPEPELAPEERGPRVNIVVDEEAPPRALDAEAEPRTEVAPPGPPAPEPADGEMPEIGSFLDSFRPGPGGGESDSSDSSESSGDAAPPFGGEFSPGPGEVTIEGEHQDPALMAKAVQTVMKRDGQGNGSDGR